jgi:uncharacterized membrane protein/predicted DsbA family dithiol-disulfide isomerase
MSSKKNRPISKARPKRFWRIAFILLCALGILLSADLLNLHIRVHTDPTYQSLCAISEQVNCETVALSSFAVFAGLPWAVWGLIGYLFMSGLCIRGLRSRRQPASWPFGILFWLSVFSSLLSIVLFGISHVLIRSFCVVCAATYIANFLLVGIAFVELRRTGSGPLPAIRAEFHRLTGRKTPAIVYVTSFAAVLAILWVALPAYWKIGVSTGPGGLLVGTTPEEFHWIGARAPVLDITDFSDYQCPHCSRGHNEIRALIGKYPDKVRLVHRHYPLKRHPFAFLYSKMAYCAGRQDRFWEANDYLFENGQRREMVTQSELADAVQIDAAELAACAESNPANQAVLDDITAGKALNIRGTPAYVVGTRVYPGRIPKEVIDSALSTATDAAR